MKCDEIVASLESMLRWDRLHGYFQRHYQATRFDVMRFLFIQAATGANRPPAARSARVLCYACMIFEFRFLLSSRRFGDSTSSQILVFLGVWEPFLYGLNTHKQSVRRCPRTPHAKGEITT